MATAIPIDLVPMVAARRWSQQPERGPGPLPAGAVFSPMPKLPHPPGSDIPPDWIYTVGLGVVGVCTTRRVSFRLVGFVWPRFADADKDDAAGPDSCLWRIGCAGERWGPLPVVPPRDLDAYWSLFVFFWGGGSATRVTRTSSTRGAIALLATIS